MKIIFKISLLYLLLCSCNNESEQTMNTITEKAIVAIDELKINYDSIYIKDYWKQFKNRINEKDWNEIQNSLAVFNEIIIVDSITYPKTAQTKRDKISFSKDFYVKCGRNTLSEYALDFNDKFRLPRINNNIKRDIINLRNNNKHDIEKYISLILLKVYKSHLTCCKQSYDIGTGSHTSDSIFKPIQYEFYQFSKYERPEALPSSAIYEWVLEQTILKKDSLIQVEINAIDNLKTN